MGVELLRRFFLFVFISVIISVAAFGAYNLSKDKVKLDLAEGYEYDIRAKGLKSPRDLQLDENGDILVALENKIQIIRSNGMESTILKKENGNINSMIYHDSKIFFISGTSLYKYDLNEGKEEELLTKIPNEGEYKDNRLLLKNGKIYIAIGSATNSGVAQENGKKDISPVELILRGKNFNGDKTGAFVDFGKKTSYGESTTKGFPSNGSIITYDILTKKTALYAWGIRNVQGMDMYSTGEIFAIVGGMEDRGLRPITGDVDYIYNIKEGNWYGWPDYSGGDPITSPKFTEEGKDKNTFVIEKHPTKNPEAPFYQSNNLSSLKALLIDREGNFVEENAMIFFDKVEKKVLTLSKEKKLNPLINIKGNGDIIDIEKSKGNVYILEKNEGIVYEIYKKDSLINTFSKRLLVSIICILLVFISTIILKVKMTKEVK